MLSPLSDISVQVGVRAVRGELVGGIVMLRAEDMHIAVMAARHERSISLVRSRRV